MSNENEVEAFFERHRLTLDLVSLTEEQREFNSMLLGGSAAKYVSREGEFEYDELSHVVFHWGDPIIGDVLTAVANNTRLPSSDFLPFIPVTVIGDQIWSLTPQDSDWDPGTAYEKEEDYVFMPYEADGAEGALAAGLFKTKTGMARDIIGKIGNFYVAFSIGAELDPGTEKEAAAIDMQKLDSVLGSPRKFESAEGFGEVEIEKELREAVSSFFNQERSKEFVSDQEAIDWLGRLMENWHFEKYSDQDNSWFAFNIAHWTIENFGQGDTEHGYVLFGGDKYHDGFAGEDLPPNLQQLITHVDRDEIFLSGDNSLVMQTKHDYLETDPFIPRWEEIKAQVSFPKMLEFIRKNPDIKEGIILTQVEFIPQVAIYFEPAWFHKWGLEFLVNQFGTRISPFGERGNVWAASDFVVEARSKPVELAFTVCALTMLAAIHGHRHARDVIPAKAMDQFFDRLSGKEKLPIVHPEDFHLKSGNAIKNLLIQTLMEDEKE